MNETVASMNGTIWIFAALLIGMVIVQAILFARLALRFNKKNQLVTRKEIVSAMSTETVSVVGPAISSTVVALSLVAMVGPATAFMRCGVIGAPPWELFMANTAAGAVGVAFNTPEFTKSVFTLCIFGMTFASAPYFINTILTLKPLDMAVIKAQTAVKKSKESFLPSLGNAAMMGLMGYSIVDYIKTIPGIVAVVVACSVAYAVTKIIAKTGFKWLNDWNMAFSMVIAMAVAQVVSTVLS